MNYLAEFYENLGNKYTVLVVAFLTGFAIGATRLGSNMLIGLIVGLVFAITAGLAVVIIDKLLPKSINVPLLIAPLVTVCILIVFFIVMATSSIKFNMKDIMEKIQLKK
jgi:hypothetical protein